MTGSNLLEHHIWQPLGDLIVVHDIGMAHATSHFALLVKTISRDRQRKSLSACNSCPSCLHLNLSWDSRDSFPVLFDI